MCWPQQHDLLLSPTLLANVSEKRLRRGQFLNHAETTNATVHTLWAAWRILSILLSHMCQNCFRIGYGTNTQFSIQVYGRLLCLGLWSGEIYDEIFYEIFYRKHVSRKIPTEDKLSNDVAHNCISVGTILEALLDSPPSANSSRLLELRDESCSSCRKPGSDSCVWLRQWTYFMKRVEQYEKKNEEAFVSFTVLIQYNIPYFMCNNCRVR